MGESEGILCVNCGGSIDDCSCVCPYCGEVEDCACCIGYGCTAGGL